MESSSSRYDRSFNKSNYPRYPLEIKIDSGEGEEEGRGGEREKEPLDEGGEDKLGRDIYYAAYKRPVVDNEFDCLLVVLSPYSPVITTNREEGRAPAVTFEIYKWTNNCYTAVQSGSSIQQLINCRAPLFSFSPLFPLFFLFSSTSPGVHLTLGQHSPPSALSSGKS